MDLVSLHDLALSSAVLQVSCHVADGFGCLFHSHIVFLFSFYQLAHAFLILCWLIFIWVSR